MAGHFEMKTRSDGRFQFYLKSGKGETVLTSQAYTTKAACLNGVESVKQNAPDDDRYRTTTTPDGHFRFALESTNGQAVGSSAYYETEVARAHGMESVKKNAPGAEVKDLT